MSMSLPGTGGPFGRVLSAMITPLTDGGIDLDGVGRLATHLVDEAGHDGLVINGTTGEAPTTTDVEKDQVLRAVLDAVGDRATIVAGVGTADTAHSIELARAAERAGAHGLLVVTPYYSCPPQEALRTHLRSVADSVGLPLMLYDIPGRAGAALTTETLVRLAEHPRIVALKDAKGNVAETSWVLARSDLAVYSGDDVLTLPLAAVGAVGVVGVVTHVAGPQVRAMLLHHEAGRVAEARALHHQLMPVFTGFFRTQGVILVKAALKELGLPAGPVRLPLMNATADELEQLRDDCLAAGLPLNRDALVPSV